MRRFVTSAFLHSLYEPEMRFLQTSSLTLHLYIRWSKVQRSVRKTDKTGADLGLTDVFTILVTTVNSL